MMDRLINFWPATRSYRTRSYRTGKYRTREHRTRKRRTVRTSSISHILTLVLVEYSQQPNQSSPSQSSPSQSSPNESSLHQASLATDADVEVQEILTLSPTLQALFYFAPTEALFDAATFYAKRPNFSRGLICSGELQKTAQGYRGDLLVQAQQAIGQVPEGKVLILNSTYLLAQRGEIKNLCRPSSLRLQESLLTGQNYLLIKNETIAKEISASTHRSLPPATFAARCRAALFDYLIAFSIYCLFFQFFFTPEQLSRWWEHRRLEAENMEQSEATTVRDFFASSAAFARLGTKGSLVSKFPFKTGDYYLSLARLRRSSMQGVPGHIVLQVQSQKFPISTHVSVPWSIETTYNDPIHLVKDNEIRIVNTEESFILDLDYIGFQLADSSATRHSAEPTINIFAYDDFIRLIGRRGERGLEGCFFTLLLYIPIIQVALQCLFLIFFSWTPGCRFARIRIVDTKNLRSPGIGRATLRFMGYIFCFVPPFTIGLLLPLARSKSKTASLPDSISGTKVLSLEADQ